MQKRVTGKDSAPDKEELRQRKEVNSRANTKYLHLIQYNSRLFPSETIE